MLRVLLLSTLAASCLGAFFPSAVSTTAPRTTAITMDGGLASTAGAVAGASVAATIGLLASAPVELGDQVVVAADTAGVLIFAVAVVQAYLTYSDKTFVEAATSDEACLLQDTEPVCGPLSFDSTDDMMCIETYREGKLEWVCA
jgi:hypothetical protein